MSQVSYQGYDYSIPDEVKEKYKELIQLVLDTPSMTYEEKQYWFKILPIMNKEQLKTLYGILSTERKKLDELDKKYQKEIQAAENKKTFDPEKMKSDRATLRAQEAAHEKAELEHEDALLEELENL